MLDQASRFMKTAHHPRRSVAPILCALTASAPLDAHDPIGSRVTWTGDIARIFQARCVGCHSAGSVDPMPLTTYEEAQPWASAIRQQVLSRKMPIWHAARGFGEFANDPSLSPFDIALIAAWANAGGPRGDDTKPGSVPETRPERPARGRLPRKRERSGWRAGRRRCRDGCSRCIRSWRRADPRRSRRCCPTGSAKSSRGFATTIRGTPRPTGFAPRSRFRVAVVWRLRRLVSAS